MEQTDPQGKKKSSDPIKKMVRGLYRMAGEEGVTKLKPQPL